MQPAAMGMPRRCLMWFKGVVTVTLETLAKTGPLLGLHGWLAGAGGPCSKCVVDEGTRVSLLSGEDDLGCWGSQDRDQFCCHL